METADPIDSEVPAEIGGQSQTDTQLLRRDAAKSTAQPFDFRHPVFLSSPEWRKLRQEVEEFVASLGALFATYLRLDFGLQLARMRTMPFSEFTGGLPAPTHLALFKIEPLRGVSVLELRPAIGLAIVDRLLGGPGQPASVERDLTEMEVALLDEAVRIMLGEWCKQWSKLQELRAEILGHENNPRFLQSSTGDTTVLVVTMEARMGEIVDQVQLAFPYAGLEPLVLKLTETATAPAPAQSAAPVARKWNHNLDDVALTITALWPSQRLPAKKVIHLQAGDVLELTPESSEKIELHIGRIAKFKGRLGTRDGKWAIQINTVCKS